MLVQDEDYINQLSKVQYPIPGQSLTNDPDNPLPFEGPPEFTKRKDALEAIFDNLIRPEVYEPLIEALSNEIPVMDITQVLLFEGFREGKWNPDLFMMLIEPTAYTIMALGERVGVDYVIDREVDPEEEEATNISKLEESLKKAKSKIKDEASSGVPEGVVPTEIMNRIEELEEESLLSKPSPKEDILEMEDEDLSLLDRG